MRVSADCPTPAMGDVHFSSGGTNTHISGLSVLILNDFCHVQGGASKVAIDDAISLSNAGINVIFVGAVGPICAELQAAPLEVVCLNQPEILEFSRRPWVVFQGLWNVAAGRQVRKILHGLSPDRTIVHLHGYTKALTVNPVKVARDLGFAVVCTLHDFFAACPNGAFFDYREGQPCRRRALSAACIGARCDKRHHAHKMFRVTRGLLQKYLGGFPAVVDNYISLSKGSAALLRPYLPAGAQISALENAIDWGRPPQVQVGDNRSIVYVGRLDQEKGVLLLAEAAMRLNLTVTFVGDGPLRSMIEGKWGMSVTGWVSRDKVCEHLAVARCLVFPSTWYETYGLVVAEACAHGIPVIVSDITAAAERINDGVTGWIFRSGNMEDLVRCLKYVNDDFKIKEVGDAAYRAFWSDAMTGDKHARDLSGIYTSILQS